MTDQQVATKMLDNHVWREKWDLISTLRFLWETLGPECSFYELMDMINGKLVEMNNDGSFDHDRFREGDYPSRKYKAAMLELAKEIH